MFRLRLALCLAALASLGISHAADLSPLAPPPRWETLNRYQNTITHDDFVRLLTTVYASRGYGDLIQIDDHSARIVKDREARTFFILRFAHRDGAKRPPRYWRRIAHLAPAPAARPLEHLRVALDPGHIGGQFAKMEERWYQVNGSAPVEEGEMTLAVAKILAQRLKELGAEVSFVRSENAPVTPKRPDAFREVALEVLRKAGVADPPPTYSGPADPAKEQSVQWQTELLFYRQSEIRERALKVNKTLRPDLVLCLHFNAEAWGDPNAPTLLDKNHFHVLVNGSYLPDEIAVDDQRFEMLQKLLSRAYDEELPLADEMAAVFARETALPPYEYTKDTVAKVGTSGYVYARNLLATRTFNCPVVYFEPYVMNSHDVFARVQAGDYEGVRDVNGIQRPNIFREYAKGVADGLEEFCRAHRKITASKL
ncbi:MAG: N-acetylmuramoyl-L-alanine amidase [Verrucomicrobiota bacterium]|nr:N-acetylmuramoyl-L-alanine amidase [Verrucomicrobiota bacterium]